MKSVGIRQLRQEASRLLREVERGATVEVTDRGRPVALLVPVPRAPGIDALVTSGRLVPASGDIADLGEPLEAVSDVPLPSKALADARADER